MSFTWLWLAIGALHLSRRKQDYQACTATMSLLQSNGGRRRYPKERLHKSYLSKKEGRCIEFSYEAGGFKMVVFWDTHESKLQRGCEETLRRGEKIDEKLAQYLFESKVSSIPWWKVFVVFGIAQVCFILYYQWVSLYTPIHFLPMSLN